MWFGRSAETERDPLALLELPRAAGSLNVENAGRLGLGERHSLEMRREESGALRHRDRLLYGEGALSKMLAQ